MPRKKLVRAAFGIGSLLGLNLAHGLTFQFDPGFYSLPQPVQDGFIAAAARWSANISTNTTITVNVDFRDLNSSVILGQTSIASNQNGYSYFAVRQALALHSTSADDATALLQLPALPRRSMWINRTSDNPNGSGSAVPYLSSASKIVMSLANAQALGLSTSDLDGAIDFNSNPGILWDQFWDFNPLDGITPGQIDFVGVATHELGHVLGFNSVVDDLDQATVAYTASQITPTTMDLFRFSSTSQASSAIDLTTDTTAKYFSIDGGTTQVQFSTGVKYGDGRQASHWKDTTPPLGIMDPTAAYGERLNFTAVDRTLFDVIGYDLSTQWSWSGGVSGNAWSDPLNWQTACVPDAGITVKFDLGGTYTTQLPAQAVQAAGLLVHGNSNLTLNTGTTTLTLGGPLSVGSTTLGNGTMTLAGSGTVITPTVTVVAASTLNLNAGTLSAGNLTNSGTFTQTGGNLGVSVKFTNSSGVTTLGGTQTWGTGSELAVNGGSVKFSGSLAGGTNLKLSIATGGQAVMIGARQLLTAHDLTMDSTAQLDLGTGDLLIRSPQTTTLAQITELVKVARDAGWGTTGITSTGARQSDITTLVPLLNSYDGSTTILSQLDGQNLLPTDLIVKYTYVGDVNLDGVVNGGDFAAMKTGYSLQGSLTHALGFMDGDLNFDGIINGSDFALAKTAYSLQDIPLTMTAMAAMAIVPEPATAGILTLAAAGLLLRRRRRATGLRISRTSFSAEKFSGQAQHS